MPKFKDDLTIYSCYLPSMKYTLETITAASISQSLAFSVSTLYTFAGKDVMYFTRKNSLVSNAY